jgi:hypothetical protein
MSTLFVLFLEIERRTDQYSLFQLLHNVEQEYHIPIYVTNKTII